MSTRGYRYHILTADGTESFLCHWHPSGRSLHTRPHAHIGDALLVPDAVITRKEHVPTGRVALEHVIQFLLQAYEVVPLRPRTRSLGSSGGAPGVEGVRAAGMSGCLRGSARDGEGVHEAPDAGARVRRHGRARQGPQGGRRRDRCAGRAGADHHGPPGNWLPDPGLRGQENLPLPGGWFDRDEGDRFAALLNAAEAHFKAEILSCAEDAWINPDGTRIGVEAPFDPVLLRVRSAAAAGPDRRGIASV